MNTTKNIATYLGISLACLMLVSQAAYAGVAGHAQFVNGSVQIVSAAGQTRTLQKGEAVNEGDTVISAKAASAQIKMLDGGFVAMRPDTRLKFDSFKFSGKEDGNERSYFSLFKGGFRAVTGLIGRMNKTNYRITTAASTIGIRGTDHETFVVTPDSSLTNAVPIGTYNKVNVGETFMTTDKGTIFVLPNQMGFAGAADQMPELKPLNTDIFTVADRPTKEAKGDKKEGKEDGKEVRETAKVDNTAEAEVGAAPAAEIASSTGEGKETNILQPITTTDGTDLTGEETSGGGSAPSGGPFAAYVPSYVAAATTSLMGGNSEMLVAPAGLTYVAGGVGNNSTSGALSSITSQDIGGGGAYTSTSTITGGTPTSANASAGIQYGAWTGYTGLSDTWSQSLGGKNGGAPSSWMYGPQGYVDASNGTLFAGTSAGTFTYHQDGATAPISRNTGLTGTLTSASFIVNFASMLLSGNMTLTMPGNENWGAAVTNAPIVLGSPLNVAPMVTYSVGAAVPLATCSTCSGNVSGMFTGQNLAGAILSYDLYNNAAMGGGDVSGNVALTRVGVSGNPSVTNGAAVTPTNIAVAVAGQNGSVSTYPVTSSTINTTNGLLTAYGSSYASTGYSSSYFTTVTCITCTSTASGDLVNSGIYYGNWSEGTYAQAISSTFPSGTLPAYWITGPEAGPLYLPQALTGTASYTFNAGQVSNSLGAAGTFGSTTLSLDFNKQTVGINLIVTVPDTLGTSHTWNAKTLLGNEAVLGNGQGNSGAAFSASTFNNGVGSGLLTVVVGGLTNNVTNPSGYINGQLTGSGLTGAIMSFNLGGILNAATATTYENINGVAAFTGTAANIATPYQYVSIALADPFSTVPQPVLGFYANAVSATTPTVGVKTDGSGNLTQFDTQIINNNGNGSSSTVTNVSAAIADHGTDPVSGISWGRWAGGTFNVTDRATRAATLVTQTGSLHWITAPVSTTAVTLPTTGTYTYTNAGGTSPTDNLGSVGTLNSATLSANFTAQTVNVGVNATVAGATLNAAGNSVPIIQQTVFYASSQEPAASTSHLAVTCTGTCGATLGGTVIGKFTGAGAIGAAMTYGLQNGATTISGVTAFHR